MQLCYYIDGSMWVATGGDTADSDSLSGQLVASDSTALTGTARSVRDIQTHLRDDTAAQQRWSISGREKLQAVALSLRVAVAAPTNTKSQGKVGNVWDATLSWLQGTLPLFPCFRLFVCVNG